MAEIAYEFKCPGLVHLPNNSLKDREKAVKENFNRDIIDRIGIGIILTIIIACIVLYFLDVDIRIF